MAGSVTRSSVGVALATAALGLQLGDVARAAPAAAAVVGGIGAVAAGLAVMGLLWGDCFEARLTAAVVGGMSTVLAVVGMVLGPPGSSDGGLSVRGALVALSGVIVLVLLWLASCGSAATAPPTRPYAR